MAGDDRCDVALWDVDGTLSGDLRRRLTGKKRQSGPKLSVETGRWRDLRIAVARPQRVTAVALPTIANALQALVAAHDPSWAFVLGPAAAPAGGFAVGDIVRAPGSSAAEPGEPGLTALFCNGPVEAGVVDALATRWSAAAMEAAERFDVSVDLLAAVTGVAVPGRPAIPPVSRPETRARATGRWFGRLLSTPNTKRETNVARERCARRVDEALALLVTRRTNAPRPTD